MKIPLRMFLHAGTPSCSSSCSYRASSKDTFPTSSCRPELQAASFNMSFVPEINVLFTAACIYYVPTFCRANTDKHAQLRITLRNPQIGDVYRY
jgi:hypothetical protein